MTSTILVRRCGLGGAILLAGCLLLTACGSGSGTSSAASASAPGPLDRATGQNAGAGAAAGSTASASAGHSSAGGSAATATADLAPASQSIVYTASIEIRAASVTATATRITGIVESAGGYISAETAGSATGSATGSASPDRTGQTITITVKIPVPGYDAVLARLSSPALGKQLSMHQQASDVTQQVANVTSLVTSEQAAITALDGLLQRAASVSDLLQVQQQISSDESTLNSLLAQQRALDGETSYATVSMTLLAPLHVAPRKKPAGHSFLTGLRSGWHALRHAAGWVATALGAVLPFLIIAAVLAALGYAGRRRYARRRIGPPAAE